LISIGYGHGIKGMDRIAEDEGGPRAMCTIQAGLIYAAPGLSGCTTVALIIQVTSFDFVYIREGWFFDVGFLF
jgi:hypothetical protein